ncbi:ketosteroid isomerase-like protein [Kribbella aluminosa]|uniref:Ketosteroid isomerase-like protein n=1 Tax=Kribbella aluminosa TaxID=416017 RepID=A0ABS4UTM8_9ACTN|nr:nuclear transport factor 2 family protein [Kribbella aluminosa]MBP2354911.1 ketosteroid isomerase-like protein [Kribbella aluminosa]
MTIEEQVRAVAAEWDRIVVGNDAQQVGAFMTDDWVYVSSTGPVTKAEIVSWIADGRLAHHSMQVVGGESVARAGDAVVVTARKTSTGTWAGTPYSADEWISQVWVPTQAGWRCAFAQKSDAQTK